MDSLLRQINQYWPQQMEKLFTFQIPKYHIRTTIQDMPSLYGIIYRPAMYGQFICTLAMFLFRKTNR